jgi:hypothetical protein
VLLNGSGAELARYAFTPDRGAGGDPQRTVSLLFINELVPYVPGTTNVQILGPGGTVLGSIAAGAHAPTVQLVSTERGAAAVRSDVLAPDTITLTWTASDAAPGDTLTFIVQYSADGGSTWETVAQGLTGTSTKIDRANLPRSDQALLRVIATDGIHSSASPPSAPFIVPNHPPTVRIDVKLPSPVPTPPIPIIREFIESPLCAATSDADNDAVQLEWSSNVDGVVGHEKCLSAANLSCGPHHIKVTADDGHGGQASASTDMVVWILTKCTNPCGCSSAPSPPDKLAVGPKLIMFPSQQTTPPRLSIDNANTRRSISWQASADAPWVILDSTGGANVAGNTPRDLSVDFACVSAPPEPAHITISSGDVPGDTETVTVGFAAPSGCGGNCNGDGEVTVSELITLVNIALGDTCVANCFAGDGDGDGSISISEIITAVNYALNGCG